MMLKTRHFGTLNIEEDKILNFEAGIPGFADSKRFVLLKNDDADSPFCWLQSVEEEDVALALVNPFSFYPTYSPEIKDELVEDLGTNKEEELTVYNVLVVPDDLKQMTVNLKAPIIINANEKKGMQVIADNAEYGVRHYIYQDMEAAKAAQNK